MSNSTNGLKNVIIKSLEFSKWQKLWCIKMRVHEINMYRKLRFKSYIPNTWPVAYQNKEKNL